MAQANEESHDSADVTAAFMLVAGVKFPHFSVERFAKINVIATAIWILLCFLVIREYRKLKQKAVTAGA